MCVQPPRLPEHVHLLAVEHLRRHVPDERDPLRVRDRRRRPDVRVERQVTGVRRLPDVRDRYAHGRVVRKPALARSERERERREHAPKAKGNAPLPPMETRS